MGLTCYSQNIVVIDSMSKNYLSFAKIIYGNNGIYTDSTGNFSINEIKTDSALIQYFGYKDFHFDILKRKSDTIEMLREPILLDEIVIRNKIMDSHIDFLKKPKSLSFLPLSLDNELVINIIPQGHYINSTIENVYFKIEKSNKHQYTYAIVRINIYDSDKNRIFISAPIYTKDKIDDEIKLILPKNQFIFPNEGLYFGIEVIGIDELSSNAEINKSYIGIVLTDKISNEFSSNTFLNYPLSLNKQEVPINNLFLELMPEKKYERNLSIAFDLILNEN